jgi:hypothetical protein
MILLAFLLAGLPASATPSSTVPARPQGTAAPEAKAPAPAPANRTLVGQVVSVDAAAGTLVLRETVKATTAPPSPPAPESGKTGRPAETVTVRVEATTQLLRGKRPVPLADLRPGDHAVVRYTPREPAAVALALTIRVAEVVSRPSPPPAASSSAGGAAPPPAYPSSDIPAN